MRTLLVTLLLGLACADLKNMDVSTLSGEWKTLYEASSDLEKISETGPFRGFLRKLEFDLEHDTLTVDFFLKVNGECEKHTLKGTKVGGHYIFDYAGKCDFQLYYGSENSFLAYAEIVDENGAVSTLIAMYGKGNDANEEELEMFKGLSREKNIPEENIVRAIDFGNTHVLLVNNIRDLDAHIWTRHGAPGSNFSLESRSMKKTFLVLV